MNFLVVDDEPLQLREIASVLRRLRPEAEVFSYTWPDDALKSAKSNPMDVAFLDIQMGGMTGLELAVQLKKAKPDIHIIFVTGYAQYALDAFTMHATGYLLKPVTEEAVSRELTFVYNSRPSEKRIQVKTFGGFDVYADGQPVRFRRPKPKNCWPISWIAGDRPLRQGKPMPPCLKMRRIRRPESRISAPSSMS